jgi:3-hydroxybutyryl-CoA dehydrogenase
MLDSEIASREDIDAAMRGGCSFPMGPLELLDFVGLDTSLSILEVLFEEHRDPCAAPAPLLKRMVTAGQLGRKTGQGFYDYPSAR